MKLPSSQKGFAPILLLLMFLVFAAIGTGAYFFSKQSIETKTPTLIPSLTNQAIDFPIKLLESKVPENGYEPVKGSTDYDCQPELFDPATSKFKKVRQQGTPIELYQIEGFDGGSMQVNGWNTEGEDKIVLPEPYELTFYEFGCASTFSKVIEIKRNNQRLNLYTHIDSFSISDDKKYLFLANNRKNKDGSWGVLRRIIDYQNNKEVALPVGMECVSDYSIWQKDKLLSYSDKNIWSNRISLDEKLKQDSDYKTKICLWDTQGKLLAHLEANLPWSAAAAEFLDAQIGLVPTESNVFYAYSTDTTSENIFDCVLYLQDLGNAERNKKLKLTTPQDERCLNHKIDLKDTTFEKTSTGFEVVD